MRDTHRIIGAILAFYPLIGMGVDLITPSLPFISQNLALSNTYAKNLVAIYLACYALGNLLAGILSDAWGRRNLLLVSFLLFFSISFLPVFMPAYETLFITRGLEGLAMGAFGAIGRAIFSDVLPENQLKSTLTWLATMWGIGPIIGPIIGGYLQYYFNWQSCFYFFAFYGMSGFITMFLFLPETIVCKKTLQWRPILSSFREITQNKSFIGSMIIMGSTYSILVVFSTLGPFIIQEGFHQSVVYFSHVALSLGIAFLMGTFICRYAIKRSSPTELLRNAILIGLTIILLMFGGFYYSNSAMMIVIFSSIGLVLISGILYPTGMAIGLSLFRHMAGSASAIMNFVNVLITSLVSFIMSFIDKNAAWMFVTYGILIMMTFLSYIFLVRPITGKNYATS